MKNSIVVTKTLRNKRSGEVVGISLRVKSKRACLVYPVETDGSLGRPRVFSLNDFREPPKMSSTYHKKLEKIALRRLKKALGEQ